MSDGKTVYVVTTGEYSDYSILAVFDDRALAERYTALQSKIRHADIEEYVLNEERSFVERGLIGWVVIFLADGSAHAAGEDEPVEEGVEKMETHSLHVRCRTNQPTKEAALKVCAERRARFLAEREGIA